MSDLIIIRGLPGSGKSTRAKEILLSMDACKHFENDMFHIVDGNYHFKIENILDAQRWCQGSTAFWLNRGHSVIVSNTFIKIIDMEAYFDMAKSYGARLKIIEMKSNYGSIHNVPDKALKTMEKGWEELKAHP
jgi:predicted kinase